MRKSYALKLLIYNRKRYYRTNVLLFYTFYPQEKNKYIKLFHVKHNCLKINNIPDKKEEKSVRAPAPPPRMYVKIVRPDERSKARPPYILFSGARGE